jgi:hypothetical protein
MIETSQEIKNIASALSKAQASMGGALKDASNPFFNSSYADLESVTEAIRKPATENGLAWTQGGGCTAEGVVSVTTLVLHTSGEWIKSEVSSKPKDLGPQAVGSCITYNRRYGLQSIFGLWTTEDDGNAAEGKRAPEPKLDETIKTELEVAAKNGIEAFREYWKGMDKETRKTAQGNKDWFESLRKTAEGVK